MKLKNFVIASILMLALTLTIAACEQKKYTPEELSNMPANELLDVFLENGLEISDELDFIPKETLAEIFKANFESFTQGLCFLSAEPYIELAKDTQIIYEKITK